MKRLILALLCLSFPSVLFAQSGTYLPQVAFTAFDNNGDPINGGKLCVYVSGTSTATNTYTDSTLGTLNSNPVIMNSAGRNVAGGIFLTPGQTYKFVLRQPGSTTTCADGTVVWTQDGIAAIPTSSSALDVLGTAGENILAGQAVYLSDGSGSKTAGQWFKADSTNAYSNTTPVIGMTPNAITSASVGTIRLSGQVTGLSGLTIGLPYYVSTAGTTTATAPANARLLGGADSATSLILTSNPPPTTQLNNAVNDFGLTLTTALCHTVADVTAATTIYLTPCTGNRIMLFDASGNPTQYTSAQISIAVPATTATMYDVWVYASSGTPTLELLAWTNVTTRATAIVNTVAPGVYTKSGDATRRYVGTFETTGVSGQTEDSLTKRFLYSHFNRVPRSLQKFTVTASWSYNTATWRQLDATTGATIKVELVIGVAELQVQTFAKAYAGTDGNGAAATTMGALGIGEDSITAPTDPSPTSQTNSITNAADYKGMVTGLVRTPAVGYHYYAPLERGGGVAGATTTWVSSNAGLTQAGIWGTIH